MSDLVSHPRHYTRGKIEVWDFIEDQKMGYLLGSALKYICRAGYKEDKIMDLQKAKAYIDREIEEEMKRNAEQSEAVIRRNDGGHAQL